MSAVESQRPHFSEEDACRFAQALYGITATARPLPSERDQNFHLTDDAGREFVLKISNAATKREILDLQNKAMEHLGERNESGLCPRVCVTTTGEHIATIAGGHRSRYLVRMLNYLPGVRLVDVNPHTLELLRSLGNFLGMLTQAFEGFSHPATQRDLKWNMENGPSILRTHSEYITDPQRRSLIEQFLEHYETHVVPELSSLRQSVIHNDGNDYNVLVDCVAPDEGYPWEKKVVGIIDFGDMVHSYTVCDLAVALAYVMLGKADPIAAATHVVSGSHSVYPLTEQEVALLYDLIRMRLCMSVTISAHQQQEEPENKYLSVSEAQVWELLKRLSKIHPNLAHYAFRHACGLPPCRDSAALVQWLTEHQDRVGSLVGPEINLANPVIFDLSVGSLEQAGLEGRIDTQAFTDLMFSRMNAAGTNIGLGRYNEPRRMYQSDLFKVEHADIHEWRTIHLGVDLFMEVSSPIFAPLDGTIHSFQNNTAPQDYGPTIIMHHDLRDGHGTFYTLYGHLSVDSLEGIYEGKPIQKGDQIAKIGDSRINGGWPPHLHFQIITDMLDRHGDFPGVAAPSERDIWLSLCPDPNIILRIPELCSPANGRSREDILNARQQHLGRSLSVHYNTPLKIVRGFGQYMYDEVGRAYLDAVNNVSHVGHCHPRVVKAAQQQFAQLNTNTRYLHDNLVDYAERLCATLPQPLSVCFFVCSGSEANDLALRLARSHTQQTDILVLEGAYHGNSTSLIEISPYKFDGPGGSGAPPHVHKIATPDTYRGLYKSTDPHAGERYAGLVQDSIRQVQQNNRNVCAFVCESILSCGGQIVLPQQYLQEVFRYVRNAGGVCIADEVQIGFGRVGTHFWGFETQGVVPDIVTLGKPIGNGHPMAAVITTPEIAESFANGMEYFNTFGGNPVSCAIGLAVLGVIEEEKLQDNARYVGERLKAGLEQLMTRYPLIGDVRGLGLFLGAELVLDRNTLAPAAAQASYVINRMKDEGILIGTAGPLNNVLKIKPPLVFTEADADHLIRTLDRILAEDFLQPP